MISANPLDDFRDLLRNLPDGDRQAGSTASTVFARADKPFGSLGRLEEIAIWLATWGGRPQPALRRAEVAIFAGNHGVAARGVSPRPIEVTMRAVELCAAGGAAINQVCLANDLGLKVFDLALHLPTGDITVEAALDERACTATMAFGMEAVASGADLLCIGDLGVGNSTVAAALCAAIHGGSGADWVGAGSGADAAMRATKIDVVDAALALHGSHLADPFEALRRVGGREFAAIAGAIIAARMQKIPVLLDGYPAIAAASVLHAVNILSLDHCKVASASPEPGMVGALQRIGMTPLLDLGISHGEGVGAALAAGVVKAAAQTLSGMAAALPR